MKNLDKYYYLDRDKLLFDNALGKSNFAIHSNFDIEIGIWILKEKLDNLIVRKPKYLKKHHNNWKVINVTYFPARKDSCNKTISGEEFYVSCIISFADFKLLKTKFKEDRLNANVECLFLTKPETLKLTDLELIIQPEGRKHHCCYADISKYFQISSQKKLDNPIISGIIGRKTRIVIYIKTKKLIEVVINYCRESIRDNIEREVN